jgi:ABC-type molybdate transport system substrate-binding protein
MRSLAMAAACLIASIVPAGAAELVLYGAGSLSGAMSEIAAEFDKRFGASTRGWPSAPLG